LLLVRNFSASFADSLRDPRQKKETWKDLQMVMKELGLEVPVK
jgi:hypothetical protein